MEDDLLMLRAVVNRSITTIATELRILEDTLALIDQHLEQKDDRQTD